MTVRHEMAGLRATSARSETRVTCERDKQDVRDRRGPKAEGRGSKFRTLQPSDRFTRRAFPASLARLA